jgi:hypothetical protein
VNQVRRFAILETPAALPGCCYLCKSHNRAFYVDTALQEEFHGAVYICSECLFEMSEQAGCAPPELRKKLEDRIENLEKSVYQLTVDNEGLEEAVDGLRRVRGVGALVGIGNSPIVVSSPMAEPTASAGETPVAEGEGATPEQVHDEGVAELPADDDKSSDFSLEL